MIQIGKMNRLLVKETLRDGIHLEGGEREDILLKDKYAAKKYRPGDEVEVFVYVDRNQRLLATIQKPYAVVDEFATLRVVTTSKAGAFIGWGLGDDLFVPKSEQQDEMIQGKSYVVFVFLSKKTNRVAASSRLEKFLHIQPPEYREGEEVDLIVYAKTDLGYSAVVNRSHTGMIYENEIFQKLVIGQQLKGYIKKIREDLKIDLRLQKTGYQIVDDISQTILDTIKDCGGTVAVSDKSPPEDIYALFKISKKVFKKTIGALYKKKLIVINSNGIEIIK